MLIQNNKKDAPIDESVLDETPPNINEPQTEDDKPENQDPNPDTTEKKETIPVEDNTTTETQTEEIEDTTPQTTTETTTETKPTDTETPEQKEQRYKAQQTEAQIQAARNRALTDKVTEAANIPEPTVEDLKQFVAGDGVDWDDLTPFEQSMAKKTYIADKRFAIVNQSVQESKTIDEWAGKVDTFIDENDGKPEYAKLSGHEADFRRYATKEAHRGTPIDILAAAFLHNLPPAKKVRGSLFDRSGGGEKNETPGVITDADQAANLRENDPREYKRKVKARLIKIEA